MARRGGATGAGGGGQEWLWRRCCGSRGEARVGGEVVWMVVELGGPFIAELTRSGRSSAVMAGRCGQGGPASGAGRNYGAPATCWRRDAAARPARWHSGDVTARAGGERGRWRCAAQVGGSNGGRAAHEAWRSSRRCGSAHSVATRGWQRRGCGHAGAGERDQGKALAAGVAALSGRRSDGRRAAWPGTHAGTASGAGTDLRAVRARGARTRCGSARRVKEFTCIDM